MKDTPDVQKDITSYMMELLKVSSAGLVTRPSLLKRVMKAVSAHNKASRRREELRREGLNVPPFMIFSVTSGCNLNCSGCYSKRLRSANGPQLTIDEISEVLDGSEDLGISFVLISGGEPLTVPGLLNVLASHKRTLFILFTNGKLLDEATASTIARSDNIVVMLSVEGFDPQTDGRRGQGTYDKLLSTMDVLDRMSILFGCSITVTSSNLDIVTSERFVSGMVQRGCRAFIYVEYVPVDPGSEGLVLGPTGNSLLLDRTRALGSVHKVPFISFPGDEGRWGGCISSGLGFFHIGPCGEMEPCPFAPFSDRNIRDMPLREALSSPLLMKVRELHPELDETDGGCALWKRRDILSKMCHMDPVKDL